MTTEQQFLESLFPFFYEAPRRKNPETGALLDEVDDLLEQVACQSGIDKQWLRDAAGLVVDGMAGLQCLWFLHGLGGVLEVDSKEPENPQVRTEFTQVLAKARIDDSLIVQKKKPNVVVNYQSYDWGKGYIEKEITDLDDWKIKRQTIRLGKFLRDHGAPESLIKAFEVRQMPRWNWRISAHPIDVLTMSHNRPWKSCMRPGGLYEYGPLVDMAAGSALLFFSREGSDTPCGRVILRPMLSEDGTPLIHYGDTLYGCGPQMFDNADFENLIKTAYDIEVVSARICEVGRQGRAITKFIYSDIERAACNQHQADYEDAYSALSEAPWPKPQMSAPSERAIAEVYRGKLSFEKVQERFDEDDIDDMARRAVRSIISDASQYSKFGMIDVVSALSHITDAVFEQLAGDDVFDAMLVGYNQDNQNASIAYNRLLDKMFAELREYVRYRIDSSQTVVVVASLTMGKSTIREALKEFDREFSNGRYGQPRAAIPYHRHTFDKLFKYENPNIVEAIRKMSGDYPIENGRVLYILPYWVAHSDGVLDSILNKADLGYGELRPGEYDWSEFFHDI